VIANETAGKTSSDSIVELTSGIRRLPGQVALSLASAVISSNEKPSQKIVNL
jgi:hypothetical protein